MRFKSILGAFIFICLASFIALVIFIQTKNFGRIATKVISNLSQRRAQTEVSVKSINISIFPPGVELNQVKVKKNIAPDKVFQSEFGKLGFYIGLIEVEEKKISLGEIKISDSVIEYMGPQEDDEELKEIDQQLINKIFNLTDGLPIRVDSVILENSKVIVNRDLIEAKRLKLFRRGDSFMVRFHLANLFPVQGREFSIDEIWGDAEIGRKNIDIHRLKIQHDVHTLLLKGKIKNYPLLKSAEATVSGESSVHLKNIKDEIFIPKSIKINHGYAHLIFKASLKDKKVGAGVELSLSDLDTNIVKAAKIITSLEIQNGRLKLNHLSLMNNTEKLALKTPVEIYNFENAQFLYDPINVQVQNLDLNNALRILPSLNSIKGELTGEMAFTFKNNDMEFKPRDGFVINNLGLVVGKEKPFTVLMIKKAKLTSASFRVNDLSEFRMDSVVELKNSLLDVRGMVNSKLVDFKINNATVDLEDFGNIAKLDVKGSGNLDIDVSGPLEDTNINLRGKTKNFEVLGYKLGLADKDLTIALGDSSVVIHRLESTYRNTPISGTGAINYGNLDIALGINSPKANYQDLKEILAPIFSKVTFLPSDFDFNGKLDANIFGRTSLDQLKVKSEVQFTDLVAYGESISSGELSIGLNNQILSLKNLTANKGKGQIRGDFSFNLKNDQMMVDYEWDDIPLSGMSFAKKIKLNLQGILSGTLKGEGSTKDYVMKLNGLVADTKTQDYTFKDTIFNANISPQYITGKASLLGSIVKTEFDYSHVKSRPSKIKLDIDAPDLKPFVTAFLGEHLESEEFTGSLKFHIDSKFRGVFEEVDVNANLEKLIFRHENLKVHYVSTQPQFLIQDNIIKKWNLSISESDLFVQTKGSGEFGGNVSLVNEIHFNSKIFEILFAQVLSSEGFIRNIFKVEGERGNYKFSVSSRSNDLNLTLDAIPFPLNHLNYAMEYSDDRLIIQDLQTSLENGSVAIKGDVFFDNDYPDINLKYSLDKAEIPIMGKSIINVTGEGIFLGNEPPYNVGGDILINKGHIVNELNEFSPKSNALSQVRFLPANQESPLGKLFNLNVNVKADTPVRISNSLMDVSFKGEIMLMGNPFRPKGEGRIFSPPGTSRIFFKNNEYFITSADLNFSPKKEITNPEFDVQALTYIANYKVYAKAYGDLERFNFDLTSDPALPRNSILSLIAFGYTDEIQNTLGQKDQQSLTQVGVGSFVFDRFKISDILNKQFGLQVNLGTVLEQSQTDSLLTGRTQDGQGTIGRTRSATKIELKKRLDEALTLSVSSTMGGSIGQRQSMNLNYSLSKKVQVEGVYELRTNAEGEEDIIDNSIGGDVKFRWTFK